MKEILCVRFGESDLAQYGFQFFAIGVGPACYNWGRHINLNLEIAKPSALLGHTCTKEDEGGTVNERSASPDITGLLSRGVIIKSKFKP